MVYSSSYSHAYLTEISATVGSNTITTRATYDYYRGWITSIQQPKGVADSGYDALYTYDVLGRVTKKEFPLLSGQSQRSYIEAVYDDTNRTVTLIDQLRHYVVQEYDKQGRLASMKWFTGTYGSGTLYATMSYTYTYDNQVETVTDLGGHTITHSYDFLARRTQILFPDSSTLVFSYDDTNCKTTVTNGRGYDTVFWYDWLSRLKKVEEEYATGLYTQTTYQYDNIGHLTSFTDSEAHTTTYTYASSYGVTGVTYPDSTYEETEYSDTGQILSFTDAKNNETTYTYDSMYRLTQIQYADNSTVSFTYDLNGNRIEMEDNSPNAGDYTEYTYDEWDRLLTETRHISTKAYAVSYDYDEANRLTSLIYPDGMEVLYSYDDLSQTTEITRHTSGSNDEILMDNTQYNVEGLLTHFDFGNDLSASFSFDSRHRPLTIDIKDGETSYLDLDYAYDSNDNVTQLINGWRDISSTWHSDTESYSYDGLDRLTSASCTSWSHTYSYDKAGNRTAGDGVTYTINVVNEVTSLSDGTLFTYDSNGNRTGKTKGSDTWAYTYDYCDRLTKVEKNQTVIGEYVYDGDGRRVQSTENGVTKMYLYLGVDVLYEESDTGSADYIYGPTGLLAKRTTINDESNTFYYHTDHLGSTRLVTDSSKNVVSAVAYHPFGGISTQEGSEPYLFNGKEKDLTGLYYYGARYFDPELGRFITRDALAGRKMIPQTLNRYTYCLNNPLKYIDPWGNIEDKFSYDGNSGGFSSGSSSSGTPPGSSPPDSGSSTSTPPVIPTPEGPLTVSEGAQSGNVFVGFGTIPIPGDGFREVFAVIVYDDDGNIQSCWIVDRGEFNCMEPEDVAKKMAEIVPAEDIEDLLIALDALATACEERCDNRTASGVGSTVLGGVLGYLAACALKGAWLGIPGAVAGIICGLFAYYGSNRGYQKWDQGKHLINAVSSKMGKQPI